MRYDVAMLGSGFGGSILAAILAQNGLKVIMFEAGSHPRFAIGESTTPDIGFKLKVLSKKHNIPEFLNLGNFYDLRDNIGASSGIKRAFTFLYHDKEGGQHDPRMSNQFPTLSPPMGPDCHYMRHEVDSYLAQVAMKYGVELLQNTPITNVEEYNDHVKVTANGEEYEANYVVDGTGFRSILANKHDLRVDQSNFKTNSMSLFTHMTGVKPFEAVRSYKDYDFPHPMHQTTLHHVFKEGWMWLIPFGNHSQSTNDLVSVGLMLKDGIRPANAAHYFKEFIGKYPDIAKQFEDAKPFRPWVATGRLQYGSKKLNGSRFVLLAHAAGFVDPLFSSGMSLTVGLIDKLADNILEVGKNNSDFDNDLFKKTNDIYSYNVSFYDEFVKRAYDSFSHYDSWNAWFKTWCVCNLMGSTFNHAVYFNSVEDKNSDYLKVSAGELYTKALSTGFEPHDMFLKEVFRNQDRMHANELSAEGFNHEVRELIRGLTYFPDFFKMHKYEVNSMPSWKLTNLLKFVWWMKFRSPKDLRPLISPYKMSTMVSYHTRFMLENIFKGNRRIKEPIRDLFSQWNNDWKDSTKKAA